MMANVFLVITEHEDGRLRRGSLEALSLARRLAGEAGASIHAAVLGDSVGELAQELAKKGADTVHAIEHPKLAPYTPDAYGTAIGGLVRDVAPEWVVMSHTYLAQDMLPLVAASFDAPILSDCVDARRESDSVVWMRQPYDAKYVAKTVDRGAAPRFATLQSGAFPADDLPDGHGGDVTKRDAGIDEGALRRTVIEVRGAGSGTVDLSAAEVVVAGGRGLQDKEKFEEHVGGLAKVLGGAVGASRPVVDSDWLPHEYQIGSSGQVVAPRLYVALGISGAIQHVVGIRGAQVIVAVNKDKDAPIFNDATYGIVGDLFEVVPALIEAVKEARD
jgi:electron transfer flavoprotein alpha subunit